MCTYIFRLVLHYRIFIHTIARIVDPGRIIDTRSSSNTSRTARIPSIYKRKHHKDTKKNKNMHTTKAGPPMIPPPASLSFNPYGMCVCLSRS